MQTMMFAKMGKMMNWIHGSEIICERWTIQRCNGKDNVSFPLFQAIRQSVSPGLYYAISAGNGWNRHNDIDPENVSAFFHGNVECSRLNVLRDEKQFTVVMGLDGSITTETDDELSPFMLALMGECEQKMKESGGFFLLEHPPVYP